ncbi:hypothetical protein [Luteococcus japonicus]|uniref:Uncharacterized protein n=1 Tax=Luteococcus japonicus LSP_Lj1 TaxID=1255658 RepID=A0A1R4J8G9_9ACTN|nr:hypothetical protein [Luteococcus japonicus]SJN28347.1 hypothetical protein FM114_06115 [Luteococcus japonicus LSP_Lj1]
MSSTPGDNPPPSPLQDNSRFGAEASTGPDELDAGPVIRAERFPRWLLLTAGILALVLAVAGAGIAAWRINASKPQVVITASGPRTPWEMVPPLSVDEYSRDASAADTPSANPTTKKQTIAATYARSGQNTVVLLMSRPEKDAKKFMVDLGMNSVIATEDGFCGTSVDTNRDSCALIRDNTAIMVVDLVGLSRADLMTLAHKFADSLAA